MHARKDFVLFSVLNVLFVLFYATAVVRDSQSTQVAQVTVPLMAVSVATGLCRHHHTQPQNLSSPQSSTMSPPPPSPSHPAAACPWYLLVCGHGQALQEPWMALP